MLQFSSIGEFVSVVANVVLPLLLFFQWYKSHAKEGAIKNSIVASRRMVERMHDQGANDVLDSLDATLATLGARRPFKEITKEYGLKAISLFKKEKEKPLLNLPPQLNQKFFIGEEAEQNSRRKKS